MEIKSLPSHYEQYLGKIIGGWSDRLTSEKIQIIAFKSQPEVGIKTYGTLGLSDNILKLSGSRTIRQELLVSANDNFSESDLAGFLLTLAEYVAERGTALLRGEVISSKNSVITTSPLVSVYVTNPTPFEDAFSSFNASSPPVIFAYIIPITEQEVSLIRVYGWEWFESELEQQNPDIWDLQRAEQVQKN